ncbi:MAG: hypothetical protein WCZ98_01475 [Sideroxydans sp.]
MNQPLTDFQLTALARYQDGLNKAQDAVRRLNMLAAENGLAIKGIPEFYFGMARHEATSLEFEQRRAA